MLTISSWEAGYKIRIPSRDAVRRSRSLAIAGDRRCRILLLFSVYWLEILDIGVSLRGGSIHYHSIVPVGFDVTSYTTRLIPFTSLIILVAVRPSTSCGSSKKSAVMPSVEVTARSAQTLSYVRASPMTP